MKGILIFVGVLHLIGALGAISALLTLLSEANPLWRSAADEAGA